MCGVLVEGGEREREGEKVGRGLKGKEEKKKGGGWRLKNWVKICQRSSLEGEGGKLISACHGEDIHKCSSFFDTVFRVYPFIRSLCCFCMSLSLSLLAGLEIVLQLARQKSAS